MSLINQALKEEQRRRNTASVPNAPMMAMAARRRQERSHLILLGFTGMGLVLAVSVTLVIYFGSRFLEQGATIAANSEQDAPSLASATAPKVAPAPHAELPEATDQVAVSNPIAADDETVPSSTSEDPIPGADGLAKDSPTLQAAASGVTAEQIRCQEAVDNFSVQGIRKAGKETRVFLNGKIQKLGDVVDLENGLVLLGFTADELVFRDRHGRRYSKPL